MSSAAMVSRADARLGERDVLGDRRVEVVAHHQHVEVLVDRVDGVRPRRVGRRRQHVRLAARLDDVGRVAAAGAFGVVGVDRAALERRERRPRRSPIRSACRCGSRPARPSRRRRSRQLSIAAGVVPQSSCSFRPIAPASTCSRSGAGRLALPLPRKPRFIGNASAASSMRWMCHGPGRAGRRERAGGGPGAAADHRRDARHQRLVDLLRADEVDVRVDAAGGDDHAFAGDDLGARRR